MADPAAQAEHLHTLRVAVERMLDEVPLYKNLPRPGADLNAWLQTLPLIGKRELRRGFPKSLLRRGQDLNAAMSDEKVTLLATSGTSAERLQVIWEWSWWDPQERAAMRLNARVAASLANAEFREAVLTTPACGGGTCHIGTQTQAERTLDGMLFFNESPDPSHWTSEACDRMLAEWRAFKPRGVEADPAYLARLCGEARARGLELPAPDFITLTYETTTRAYKQQIERALAVPVYQLYGATEAGVLLMECTEGLLHANDRHVHLELIPIGGKLARVVVTTLGREWMPLLRYDIGDVVRLSEQTQCKCGLPSLLPLVERLEGRFIDCLKTDSGATLTPLMLDDAIMDAAPQVQQWQLDSNVLTVVGEGASAAAQALGELTGRRIRGESASAIAAEVSGKYRLVRA